VTTSLATIGASSSKVKSSDVKVTEPHTCNGQSKMCHNFRRQRPALWTWRSTV